MDIKLNPETTAKYEQKFRDIGAKIGDQYSDKFTEVAQQLMEHFASNQGIDLQQVAEEEHEEIKDMIWSSDEFMELTVTFAEKFIEGMSDMWPYPLGYSEPSN